MKKQPKIGRNNPCPCLSGKKYKDCCEKSLDWNRVFSDGGDWREHLSIRGRNISFADRILEALQLDNNNVNNLTEYKKAFTANAVRKIHEAIEEFWPYDIDIAGVLAHEAEDVTGLYIGDYDPDYILKGIVRHSIYANKILIVDPFIYPRSVREEFNPIINPDQYRVQTLKNANFWFSLIPWIEAGIVEIIRTPADFDHKLNWESLKRQQKKFEENEELKKALKETTEEFKDRHMDKQIRQMLLLGAPDSYLKKMMRELGLEKDGFTARGLIEHIQRERDSDPNFLQPLGQDSFSEQLHMMTTGASYDIAQLTASLTNSYLVTDLYSKWREIEIDRAEGNAESKVWSPLAKAIQNTPFKYMNNITLPHALQLRKEGRLESMRSFLMRIWRDACTENLFEEQNARLLSEELLEEVSKAEEEWKKIDNDLLKIIGVELTTGLLASGPLIASGHGKFIAAAAITAGAATLAVSTGQRKRFPDRFPAAFFMKIDDNK